MASHTEIYIPIHLAMVLTQKVFNNILLKLLFSSIVVIIKKLITFPKICDDFYIVYIDMKIVMMLVVFNFSFKKGD